MKIRLKVHLSGTRNGVEWPAYGETVELPDEEAASMVAAGIAEPVSKHREAETAVPPAAENREALVPKRALKGRAK